MLGAHLRGDGAAARTGCRANAAMVVWLAAYLSGLLDGEGEHELPRFG
jgi:hypothetical protein